MFSLSEKNNQMTSKVQLGPTGEIPEGKVKHNQSEHQTKPEVLNLPY